MKFFGGSSPEEKMLKEIRAGLKKSPVVSVSVSSGEDNVVRDISIGISLSDPAILVIGLTVDNRVFILGEHSSHQLDKLGGSMPLSSFERAIENAQNKKKVAWPQCEVDLVNEMFNDNQVKTVYFVNTATRK